MFWQEVMVTTELAEAKTGLGSMRLVSQVLGQALMLTSTLHRMPTSRATSLYI